ncbi:MAG: ABC-2 type transport system permease protein [Elusimicrobia bacterium]|nr:MAG: ABC-2 type transport system permease protein [Elusimicrobiota bacterium]
MSARLGVLRVLTVRELKAYFDTPAPYVVVVAALLISGWLFSAPLFLSGRAVLDSFTGSVPLLFLFFVPALTMRLYSEEEKSGTAETLAALPVRDEDVLAAKVLAAQTVLTLFLAAAAVYPAVLRLAGRPDLGAALGAFAGLWLLGAALVSVGTAASTLTRSQTSAFIAAFMASFLFFILGKVQAILPPALADAAGAVGFDAHLEAFARGVVTFGDAVYFLSLAAFFLHLAWLRLASRRAQG